MIERRPRVRCNQVQTPYTTRQAYRVDFGRVFGRDGKPPKKKP
jgi:hypothetical protein